MLMNMQVPYTAPQQIHSEACSMMTSPAGKACNINTILQRLKHLRLSQGGPMGRFILYVQHHAKTSVSKSSRGRACFLTCDHHVPRGSARCEKAMKQHTIDAWHIRNQPSSAEPTPEAGTPLSNCSALPHDLGTSFAWPPRMSLPHPCLPPIAHVGQQNGAASGLPG